jgi:polyhydroxyalkanoate synthesis regulator phasin
MHRLAGEIEERNERIEELEARVADLEAGTDTER